LELDDATVHAIASKRRPAKRRGQTSVWVLFVRQPKARVGIGILAFFLIIAIIGPSVARYQPNAFMVGLPWQPPSLKFPFGTTDQGQDVFSQWLYGTQTSMFIGLAAGFASTVIAVFMGAFGGFKGGVIDAMFNTATNIILVLPGFPLLIVFASYVPRTSPAAITLIIALTSWAGAARLKRSQAMTFRNKDFVQAARLTGASDLRILVVEVLPNMLSFIFNNFIFASLGAIFAQAGLAFLGIGSPFTPSWGNMLNLASQGNALLEGGWWWFVPPGLSIALVGLGFTLLNYAMDEVSNPRLRKVKVLGQSKRRKSVGV